MCFMAINEEKVIIPNSSLEFDDLDDFDDELDDNPTCEELHA